MAGYNTGDISYAFIAEPTANVGIFPGSGAMSRIDHIPGTSPDFTSDLIDSPVLSANRASGGNRKVGYKVGGGIKTHFNRDDAVELLLSSALSNAWATNVLKGAASDVSFSVEKKVATGTPVLYSRFSGCQVSKFTLSVDADSNAEASFDFIGMSRATATTASALTYTAPSSKLKLAGLDVSSVTVAGLSGVSFRSLEFSVENNRETRDAFGSASAIGISTAGNRKVMLKLSFYRENFTPETVLSGNGTVAVSFTIGAAAEGYTFTLPAANFSLPADSEDGSKYMVEVEFTAKYDATSGTDVQITRLT